MIIRRAFAGAVCCCLIALAVRAADPATVETQITLPKPVVPEQPPGPPDAVSLAEGYFALGAWRIGMSREEALRHFSDVRALEGNATYTALAQAHFAADLPAELTFASDRLQSVRLRIYDGTDFDQAVDRMRLALSYMNEHFGGSNFEGGLKTSQDPQADLLRLVLRQTMDQFDHAVREVDKEEAKKRRKKRPGGEPSSTAYLQFFHFWTELEAPNNFLLGQYRFRSDSRVFTVDIYDDRAFVASRVPEATVQLFRVAAPPASE
jgi:hypothetical protein